jgi:ELWxxDGT repeat protein
MKKKLPFQHIEVLITFKRFARVSALCFSIAFFCHSVHAQPQLLKDINSSEQGSYDEYQNLVQGNGRMFFSSGGQLWTSQGTTASTTKLHDFTQVHTVFMSAGGTLYLEAEDAITGRELWKSDGTVSGTVIVKDIVPGSEGSYPQRFTEANGRIFFEAQTTANGYELWATNGTAAGTYMVKDILKSVGKSDPNYLTNVNGTLFFTANDGQTGYELWKSDGTAAGTVLVKDIRTGSKVSSTPKDLVNVNGTLYFSANDGINGAELWKSDGTSAGTMMVKDIRPGSTGSAIENLINMNGILMFTAHDGIHGDELWKSNGTDSGTVLVKDLNPGPNGSNAGGAFTDPMGNFTVIQNALYYTAGNANTQFIVRSDGTEAGTRILTNVDNPNLNPLQPHFTYFNGSIYFFHAVFTTSYTLKKMDTSGNNITTITNLALPDDYYQHVRQEFVLYNNKFYLNALTHDWVFATIDPSTGALTEVKDVEFANYGSNPYNFVSTTNLVYFQTKYSSPDPNDPYVPTPEELWRTDGTPAGTVKIMDMRQGFEMEGVGDKLFFVSIADYGWGLYVTSGAPETTTLLDGSVDSNTPVGLTNVNGTLYYFNDYGELWKSDGTEAGTMMVRDFNRILSITNVAGKAFITVETATAGLELWRTNATGAVIRVKVIRAGTGNYPSKFYPTAVIGNVYYFVAEDGVHGNEIWRSDGTDRGTYMVVDRNTVDEAAVDEYGYEYDIESFTVFNNKLYYSAKDSEGNWAFWSAATNAKLGDIDPVMSSAVLGTQMYLFVHDYYSHDIRVYISDATEAGTHFFSAIEGWGNVDIAPISGALYYSAEFAGKITKITGPGCLPAAIDAGTVDAYPIESLGNNLIFGGTTNDKGDEPYVYVNIPAVSTSCSPTPWGSTARVNTNEETLITPYPNPFVAEFALRIQSEKSEVVEVSVYNASGMPIETFRDINTNTDYSNLGANWPKGVYIIKVNRGGLLTTHRLVKN